MPGRSRQNLIYGYAYQQARKYLLSSNPMCYWCKVERATTADHEPPVHIAGPHLHLVPACRKCNFGRCNPRDLGKLPSPYAGESCGPSRDW